VKTNQSKLF